MVKSARRITVTIHQSATLVPQSRRLGPGVPWLSLKVYASANQEALLLDQLAATSAAPKMVFIRYGDPDWHLYFRFWESRNG